MPDSSTVEIQMPQMGESVTEGTVLEWHKQEGDFVEEGETVVEVSTDKVDAEVPAPTSGVISRILKGADETIEVGGVLGELDPSAEPSGNGAGEGVRPGAETPPGLADGGTGEGDADLGDEAAGTESPQPGEGADVAPTTAEATPDGETLEIVMPEMGESVAEGTILEWHKQEGETVAEGDTVVEVSTDKVDAEVPAPSSGTIPRILAQPDETVTVGQVLAEMRAGADVVAEPGESAQPTSEAGPRL